MKFLSVAFFVLAFNVIAFNQKKECDCGKYATGDFYMFDPQGKDKDTLFIHRTGTTQTESIGDYEKTHRVIWINPCKFVLRDKHNPTKKKYHPSDAVVQIIETGEDYFVVKAWAPGKKKMVLTIYVLKEE